MTTAIYTEVPPSPALASAVRCFWSIEGVVEGRARVNRVLPDGCMDIIWDLGDSPAPGYGSALVVGTMRQALVVRHRSRVDVVGVRFRPGAAPRFLGVPATELTETAADLDVFLTGAARLSEALAEASVGSGACPSAVDSAVSLAPGVGALGRAARSRLERRAIPIEDALRTLMRTARSPDLLVEAAIRRIQTTSGRVAVSELERLSSASPRTLTRRFAAAVGLTPKTACRVARMQAAAAMIGRNPAASLSRVALNAGYFDQAHFTRDFGELARITPAGYARERIDGFIQDATAASP